MFPSPIENPAALLDPMLRGFDHLDPSLTSTLGAIVVGMSLVIVIVLVLLFALEFVWIRDGR